MQKVTGKACRAIRRQGMTTLLPEELRVLETAGYLIRSYRAQRVGDSAGFWLNLKWLEKAVDEAQTARGQ